MVTSLDAQPVLDFPLHGFHRFIATYLGALTDEGAFFDALGAVFEEFPVIAGAVHSADNGHASGIFAGGDAGSQLVSQMLCCSSLGGRMAMGAAGRSDMRFLTDDFRAFAERLPGSCPCVLAHVFHTGTQVF